MNSARFRVQQHAGVSGNHVMWFRAKMREEGGGTANKTSFFISDYPCGSLWQQVWEGPLKKKGFGGMRTSNPSMSAGPSPQHVGATSKTAFFKQPERTVGKCARAGVRSGSPKMSGALCE
eukprot:CAMPEP_0194747164 /NCGR_PEP_ID=MMETSP0323_2-20130528/1238_1 /TAXON_ID=2866 ORGANISM="Crypthecodinium cohnii, Strain Seligo" /NCGR_SAMPLE_ID=MMETSP0323_2 /ASSEMBLY_ACC=CAM_ASM_000346 /LENGTH=119 /DNA_ID=CAMNT_0039660285 /DNA_START=361 /DNA_END=718 /DNA_ORIENTATION=+